VQIDVYAEQMTSQQMGVFCILGSVATTVMGYAVLLVVNIIVFFKLVLPKYKLGFQE